jgi:hypothetical protein
MKFLNLYIVLILGTLVSCTKDENTNCMTSDCSDKIIKEQRMVRYTNQESYCFSLNLWIFENRQYYTVDCCVCDQIPYPFDCNNEYFCETNGEYNSAKCNLFFLKAKHMGIIGILE